MAYGLGASIVIIGALFKINHWELGPLNGTILLAIGLITEAIIFAISAFEPVQEDVDWSLVYPELAGGKSIAGSKKQVKEASADEAQSALSKKLDDMLKEAKLDSNLMSSLADSIRNFEGAAKGIAPTTDAMSATKKYGEEMSLAAAQLESLNSLYKVQVESTSRQAEINQQVVENADQLKQQMQAMATNLSSLNGIYGGMLSAMSSNKG